MGTVDLGLPSWRPPHLAVKEGDTRAYLEQHDPNGPLRVSNSELQTWKECHRKWWLAYYAGLRLDSEHDELHGARSLGSRIHDALEHYYTKDTPVLEYLREMYQKAEEYAVATGRQDQLEALWKEYDLAHAMMSGYMDWVEAEGIDDGIDVVATEDTLEVKTNIPGVKLRGKLDQRVVRKSDQARLFRDFKTVGNLTSPTKMLHMDEQMMTYHLLEYLDSLQKTGGEPQWRTDGALYTMLRKVKRTASANPPFYGQVEVRHNIETIKSMWMRVIKEIEEIFDARMQLDAGAEPRYVVYPRPNGDCSWKCDFFPICPMFDDGANVKGMIEAYYTVGDVDERYNPKEEDK